MLLLAVLPPLAASMSDFQECRGLTASRRCHVAVVPLSAAGGSDRTFYLYLHAATCPPADADCRATPNPNHTLPGGGSWGLVYEETNGLPGLQRFPYVLPDGRYPPDTMVVY